MRKLAEQCVNQLRMRNVDYGDIRIVHTREQHIEVKNGAVASLADADSLGFGVRALVGGAWGFAASNVMTSDEITRVVDKAVKIAEASAKVPGVPIAFPSARRTVASFRSQCEINPFDDVTLEEKLEMLIQPSERMLTEASVSIARCFFSCYETTQRFVSTEGSSIYQTIIKCGAGMTATAIDGGEVQIRSYPNSFRGNFATQGFEYVKGLDLAGNASRVAEEAAQLLKAPQCPSSRTTVIIDGSQLALQIHESIGHPIELDRVLGLEAGFAGTSFLKPEDAGKLRYGSDLVTVVADATVPGGLGSFGYDDEGVKATRSTIIRDGIFRGFLTSRETAAATGRNPNGAMRADGWKSIPLIRMTNINLEPGNWTLDDLIKDTEDGIYMSTNRSWSIDDKRMNFQFGCEIAWEIKDGQLGRVLKNPTYTGMTTEFWGSCDAVCDEKSWAMWGTPNCGKGEPMQTAHVGHGAAPARFRDVQVGVMQ